MPPILARLTGVYADDIKKVLMTDAPQHTEQGVISGSRLAKCR
jgi:hypothetical protein